MKNISNLRRFYLLRLLRKIQKKIDSIIVNPIRIESVEYVDENKVKQKYILTSEDNYCILKLDKKYNLYLDKNGYLYPVDYITYYCVICGKKNRKRVDHFFEDYPNRLFCKECHIDTIWNKYIPGINEFIDLPRTKALTQVKEIKIDNDWKKVNSNDLKWGIIQFEEKRTNIRLFYKDRVVKSLKYICAKCGRTREINYPSTISLREVFYCNYCNSVDNYKYYLDLNPQDKGQDTSDLSIIEVRTKIDKKWYKVKQGDFQIKIFELMKDHPNKYLIYNGLICDKLKYKCKKNGEEIEVWWRKFKLNKHSCICSICAQKLEETNKKRSESLKKIFSKPEIKRMLSNRPKYHFKLSSSIKIKISKSVKRLMHQPEMINKVMHGIREYRLKHISKPQRIASDYIIKLINKYQIQNNFIPFINYIEEYPIPFYRENISYTLVDICFPQQKIIIEILGDYWHELWISCLKDFSLFDVFKKQYKDNKQLFYRLNQDYLRDKTLKELGWKIIYISESEVNNKQYKKIIDDLIKENRLWEYPLSEDDKKYLK